MRANFQAYYALTKPGIVYGNALHTLAGSLFALAAPYNFLPAIAVVIGAGLVIASACVVNNFSDRQLDARMQRTSKRPSVTGEISLRNGVIFAVILFVLGSIILLTMTNLLTWLLGVVAHFWYTVLYAKAKRVSPYGTLFGTVPGALPIVAGYTAVAGQATVLALLLGLMLVVWQMAHFYAIAIYRRDEYAAAGVPVVTIKTPFKAVRRQMIAYGAAYLLLVIVVAIRYPHMVGAWGMLGLGALYWLSVLGGPAGDAIHWAKRAFGASLVVSLSIVFAGIVAVASSVSGIVQ